MSSSSSPNPPEPSEVTLILREAARGAPGALDRLFSVVYGELRRLAQSKLAHERPDHTLQATALVHEAYLKLVDQKRVGYQNGGHFFAVAAQAIRRILVDHARRRSCAKRGGNEQPLALEEALDTPATELDDRLVALDEALTRLAAAHPEKARVVELRYFVGFSEAEIAEQLGVSVRTVRRYWASAQTWLQRETREPDENSPIS